MKLRVMPILLMLVGIGGAVLYATMPIIVVKANYVWGVQIQILFKHLMFTL